MEAARRATAADVADVVRLAGAFGAEIGPMKGGALLLAREARTEDSYAALVDAPGICFVVGTYDDAVVGFGVVEVEDLRDGTRLGVVTDLFVDAEARSVGIGEAMLAALREFCADQGCLGMDARALPGHRATKNFFEEQGFTARALVMHHALLPAAGDPDPEADADAARGDR